MCLGTFSRRGAVASATIYPCAECASSQSVFVPNALRRNLLRRRKQSVLHNHFLWTFLCADSAALTGFRINLCEEVRHFRCANRAVSLTECTADTTCAALLHRHRTFCLGATCHQILCIVRNQRNQVLRTCCDTFFHMPCRLPYRQLLRRLRHGLRRRDMPFTQLPKPVQP